MFQYKKTKKNQLNLKGISIAGNQMRDKKNY